MGMVYCLLYCTCTFCCSDSNPCSTASLESEVKLSAVESGSVREAEMSVVSGEEIAEGEVPLAAAASEAVHQPSTDTDTVTAASLLPQPVQSTSPSLSPELNGKSIYFFSHCTCPCTLHVLIF